MSKLWYKTPANIWEEALPVGNGSLGAMIYGKVTDEVIQVNEESMWYGAPTDRINEDALISLPQIRKYIFDGEINKAEELMKYSLSGTPDSMHPYQTLGNIHIHFKNNDSVEEYYRELDISSAIYRQIIKSDNDIEYGRQIFISKPAKAMIMRFTAPLDRPLSFDVILRREKFFDGVKKIQDNGIYLYGNLGKGGFNFGMSLSASVKDGDLKVIGEHLIVEDSTEVILYFTANTTYSLNNYLGYGKEVTYDDIENENNKIINGLKKKTYSMLVKEHMEDYQSLYDRVNFELNHDIKYDAYPTDERIKNVSTKKGTDLGLNKLYFDYGRYLLICCSRKGGLPATLQGLWNKDMLPPWDSKYTININTQMNYWPAEVCNLSECHEPLFELIKKLSETGKQTAKKMYGCRGFVAHHNTDIHGDSAPQDLWIPGSYWVMGGAWLCTHLWTHYEYTLDKEFLREYFPIMREAALFFVDFLVEHNGYMVTCPSVSPENTFILENGQKGSNIYGVTMDNQILTDLFRQCIKAAQILEIEDAFNEKLKDLVNKLIPTQISEDGYILEWPQDFEEAEPGHRHISHLYGLYPSDQISVDETPNLAKAAKVTLERRLAKGGGHTGWSRAWIINHYAKLWEGDNAYENLKMLYANSTYGNLFDMHPPFQIDGNFGATAAIANMLVQSNLRRVVILPALPTSWKSGHIKGLKIKNNGNIDISWEKGKLKECIITFYQDTDINVRCAGYNEQIAFKALKPVRLYVNRLGKIKKEEIL